MNRAAGRSQLCGKPRIGFQTVALPSPAVDHSRYAPSVRTRHLDLVASFRQDAVNRAARDEAVRVVERWNMAIAAGHDVWWSPTIRAALSSRVPLVAPIN
jgi:hypothetical protein